MSFPVGYTPQYSFWPHYFTPPETLLAPARRAGVMLFVIGLLMLLLGAFGAVVAGNVSDQGYVDYIDKIREVNPEGANQLSAASPGLIRGMYVGFGIVVGVIGLVLALLGWFVRHGSLAAAILGLLAVVVPIIGIAFIVLASIVTDVAGGLMVLILMAIPMALLLTTAGFLIAAAKNASKVTEARAQLAMMHQQQQMMMHYGYTGGAMPAYGMPMQPTTGPQPTQPQPPTTPQPQPQQPQQPSQPTNPTDAPTPPPAGG